MHPTTQRRWIRLPDSPLTTLMALALLGTLALVGCSKDNPTSTSPLAPVPMHVTELSPDLVGGFTLATTLGGPVAGLAPGELARFEEGLGPIFNDASCFSCHNAPMGGTNGRLETRFGRSFAGNFDPLAGLGGSLMQDHAIGAVTNAEGSYTFVPEVVPRAANRSTARITTPLFGLGLVDAIPDQALMAVASRQDPRIRGRVHMVKEIRTGRMRVGKFGWKAQVPTLFQFAGDAYLNEMGITNPQFPTESAPQGKADLLKYNPAPELNDDGEGVALLADFMTFLGPPPRGNTNAYTQAGERVFANIGCAGCHTMTHLTGNSPVAAMSQKVIHPYSDFLLHDMGRLGDGIVQGDAGPRDIKTPPLWGLMARPAFLHDGRAKTPEAAILAHDGQGAMARNNFAGLDFRQRQYLMAFLKSL